ncbi:uncharacterized protein LOC129743931 [Uranotaenia lowii]|uniref:uncharacterized protein LOC129743931 n=1 Tax=Uranotaenia lowii TaxID=190385 RepID=UPI00247AFF7F|nr:uncharacterized protein LOC129743931 [Uranotaenia lowii]
MKLSLFFVLCGFLVVATSGQSTLPASLKKLGVAVANVAKTVKANIATVQLLGGTTVVTALQKLEADTETFSTTLSNNAVDLTQVLSGTVTRAQAKAAFNSLTAAVKKLNTDLKAGFKTKSPQLLINAMTAFYETVAPTVTQIVTLLQNTPGTASYNVLTGINTLIADASALAAAVQGIALSG